MFKSSLTKGHGLFIASIAGLATALLFTSAQSVEAQGNRSATPESSLVAGAPETLKQKLSLPDLPEYTGKSRFLHGLVYNHINESKNKQGPAYVMSFNAKETQDQVHEWWLNSLRQYRWNITYTSKDIVHGTSKDGNTCIIQISGPVYGYDKDDRSSYVVRYQASK